MKLGGTGGAVSDGGKYSSRQEGRSLCYDTRVPRYQAGDRIDHCNNQYKDMSGSGAKVFGFAVIAETQVKLLALACRR